MQQADLLVPVKSTDEASDTPPHSPPVFSATPPFEIPCLPLTTDYLAGPFPPGRQLRSLGATVTIDTLLPPPRSPSGCPPTLPYPLLSRAQSRSPPGGVLASDVLVLVSQAPASAKSVRSALAPLQLNQPGKKPSEDTGHPPLPAASAAAAQAPPSLAGPLTLQQRSGSLIHSPSPSTRREALSKHARTRKFQFGKAKNTQGIRGVFGAGPLQGVASICLSPFHVFLAGRDQPRLRLSLQVLSPIRLRLPEGHQGRPRSLASLPLGHCPQPFRLARFPLCPPPPTAPSLPAASPSWLLSVSPPRRTGAPRVLFSAHLLRGPPRPVVLARRPQVPDPGLEPAPEPRADLSSRPLSSSTCRPHASTACSQARPPPKPSSSCRLRGAGSICSIGRAPEPEQSPSSSPSMSEWTLEVILSVCQLSLESVLLPASPPPLRR
ncbi:proline-rich protein 36-like [Suricata suricatta]|uniref:proline-rich protein 36-like n=1 Tax=Suricata suricatta TaxID=37032 RepID=UPI0011562B64|nr:proline-rich protein 36-like [Suricata suricatta]